MQLAREIATIINVAFINLEFDNCWSHHLSQDVFGYKESPAIMQEIIPLSYGLNSRDDSTSAF